MEHPPKPLQQETEFVFNAKDLQVSRETDRSASSHPAILRVKISQLVDAEFGGYLWPSSHPLAWWIWAHPALISGKRVLEVQIGPLIV